jgi:hypothetical protein
MPREFVAKRTFGGVAVECARQLDVLAVRWHRRGVENLPPSPRRPALEVRADVGHDDIVLRPPRRLQDDSVKRLDLQHHTPLL